MNRIGCICCFVLLTLSVRAQQCLEVIYQRDSALKKEKVERVKQQNPGLDADVLKGLEKEGGAAFQLRVIKGVSLFEPQEKEADLMADDEVKIVLVGPGYSDEYRGIYRDLAAMKQVVMQEFLTKMFVIEEPLSMPQWELTEETKEILGKRCTKAILTEQDGEVTAWFCPEIAVNEGPDVYWGLPGLILELTTGKEVYTCQSIDWKTTSAALKPRNGKKVTRQELEEIKTDKLNSYKSRR